MEVKHILPTILAILMIKDTRTSIYYSKTPLKYNDSVAVCKKADGQLLGYGQTFLAGVSVCENNTEPVTIWTGHPHYNYLGCTQNQGNKQSAKLDKIHFAVCADFCGKDVYSHVGITDTQCMCYLSKPVVMMCINITHCPGNPHDSCGKGTSVVVYQKVYNKSCVFRQYVNGSHSNAFLGIIDEASCGCYFKSFFCKVGTSDDVICDWLPQITLTMSTTDKGFLTKTTNTEVFRRSTLVPNINNITEKETGQNCTVILVVSIILVITSTSINIAVLIYRTKYSNACKRTNHALYTTAISRSNEHCYESPSMQHLKETSKPDINIAPPNGNNTSIQNETIDKEYAEIN